MNALGRRELSSWRTLWQAVFHELIREYGLEEVEETAIQGYTHVNPAIRWIFHKRLRGIYRVILGLHSRSMPRVLDFGCGSGFFSSLLRRSGCEVVAVDAHTKFFETARQRHPDLLDGVQLVESLGEVRGDFDVVVAADVLEHPETDELRAILRRFSSLLNGRKGRLVLSCPTENRMYKLGRWIAGFPAHWHKRNADDVILEIEGAGWTRRSLEVIPAPFLCEAFKIASFSGP